MGSRFVRPDTCVLSISNGDTLTVKRRLSAGEQRAMFTRMYLAGIDGNMRVNPLQTGMATVTAYLVDWTVTDDAGAVVPIRGLSMHDLEAVLDNLTPESFSEILKAIEGHEAAMTAERSAEKNGQGGETGSSATSPSPSNAGGASSGSAS